MQNQTNTVEICGKNYEIKSFVKVKDKGGNLAEKCMPLVDAPGISDYEWQLMALKSRLEHPELYEKRENVSEAKEDLTEWLSKRTTETLFSLFQEEFKECYDYIFQMS